MKTGSHWTIPAGLILALFAFQASLLESDDL